MIFHTVNIEMNTDASDKAATARVIFNYFVFQQEEAIRHYAEMRGDYEGALAANERAQKVYEEECEGLGMGIGPDLPYKPYNIEVKKKEMEKARKDLDDAKRLLAFIRERFVEKFIQ